MTQELELDLDAYKAQLSELRTSYGDRWVIFKGGIFEGAFASYDSAVRFGLERFGETADFLLRQIEDRPVNIPMLFVRE